MKVLITGIDGFVGGHLAKLLTTKSEVSIVGTTYFPTERYSQLTQLGIELCQIDLTSEDPVFQLLTTQRPDQIYHLAAQASVHHSHKTPWETLSNNIHSQLNILHGVAANDLAARILVVGSGEEYGPVLTSDNPIDENQPLRPQSPYAVSKVAQDMLGLQYFLSHDVQTIRVRPFNHTGPGQGTGFVAPDFASQIAAIEKGLQDPVISVGNLQAARDFSDVRDIVQAYVSLMEKGNPGDVYNLGSGQAYTIQQILDMLLGLSTANIRVEVDPERFRPVEVPVVICNAAKAQLQADWAPSIKFEQTLHDVLEDWRSR